MGTTQEQTSGMVWGQETIVTVFTLKFLSEFN